jgi:hypothetical protein
MDGHVALKGEMHNKIWLQNLEGRGARGSVVVEALWYKPEGRGIASQ